MSVTAVPIRPIKRGSLTKLWLGIALVVAIAAGVAWAGTRGAREAALTNVEFLAANADNGGVVTTPSGLQYKVLERGSGRRAQATDLALIEYEGRLRDGTVFDTSARAGGPVPLPVAGSIPGFSEGLQLMNAGSRYRFWIPSELAYGPQSPGPAIPPDSLLVFDVTLRDVRPLPPGAGGMFGGQ